MPLWSTWLEQRPYDLVVVFVIVLLVVSAYGRTGQQKTSKILLASNWAVISLLVLSLQPIYMFVDPLLGGRNFVNLLQRIALNAAGFGVTVSLTRMTRAYFQEEIKPLCAHWIWLPISVIGLGVSFVLMGANYGTSRGLDDYSSHLIAYPAYQFFSLLGLMIGVPYLVPRLYKIVKTTTLQKRRLQTSLFLVSYALSPLAILCYLLTPVSGVFLATREFCVYATFIALTTAFMLAMQDRKSLSA
ncbi:hypothetical protein ACIP5Z_11370 [Rothia terrae]|uniref:hypothetical protein n=1 Tax=Rothia terrae TaxID=396015 RepID=UPI003814443D